MIPQVITGGDHIDPRIVELTSRRRRDTSPTGSIFTISDDQIYCVLLPKARKQGSQNPSARTTDDISNE
jgi:hypothetical protein